MTASCIGAVGGVEVLFGEGAFVAVGVDVVAGAVPGVGCAADLVCGALTGGLRAVVRRLVVCAKAVA